MRDIYPPLYSGNRRGIMSVASGMSYAREIANLRNIITAYFSKRGRRVSWEHSAPREEGNYYVWFHTFKADNGVSRDVIFKERNTGQLTVIIDGFVVAKLDNNSNFGKEDVLDIIRGLGGFDER